MFRNAVGHSDDIDMMKAAAIAVDQCRAQLASLSPQAGIVYASATKEAMIPVLEYIRSSFPEMKLVGCSTDGEFSSVKGSTAQSLLLTVFASDRVGFGVGIGSNLSADLRSSLEKACAEGIADLGMRPALCIPLPDGLNSAGLPITETLASILGQDVPVVGGCSGCGSEPTGSLQFSANGVYADAVPLLFMGGDLAFSFGMASGWKPIGPEMLVTRSSGACVHEINNMKAADYFTHYLGKSFDVLTHLFLSVQDKQGNRYLRSPRRWALDDGSILFSGIIPEGSKVRLTDADRDDIIAACEDSANQALSRFSGTPCAALLFSCTTRRQMLGSRTCEELQILQQDSLSGIPASGFYTYGEICPPSWRSRSIFNNASFITLLLGVRSDSGDMHEQ